jgi:hypothetical protein
LNKCGLITAGVGCAVTGVVAFILGAIMLVNRCITETNTVYYVDDLIYDYNTNTYYTTCYYTYGGVLQLVSGALMISAAACTFTFACGARYRKFHDDDDDNDDHGKEGNSKNKSKDTPNKAEEEEDPEAGDIPAAIPAKKGQNNTRKSNLDDSVSHLSTGSTYETKTITTLPDGSIKTDIESFQSDGSRVVTTTIKNPKEAYAVATIVDC